MTTIRKDWRLIPAMCFKDLIGARHVIQRYFVSGFDVLDENPLRVFDTRNMYLMEFMSVMPARHYPEFRPCTRGRR